MDRPNTLVSSICVNLFPALTFRDIGRRRQMVSFIITLVNKHYAFTWAALAWKEANEQPGRRVMKEIREEQSNCDTEATNQFHKFYTHDFTILQVR